MEIDIIISRAIVNLLPPLLSVPSATSETRRTIPMQPTSLLPGHNCSTDYNVNFHNLIDSILSNVHIKTIDFSFGIFC
jgi:hypothetical protein